MKRYSDPTYEIVFPKLVRVLRKLLEKCFRGENKYTFAYPGQLKTDSNNASLLSGCCYRARHDLKGCSVIIIGLWNSRPF